MSSLSLSLSLSDASPSSAAAFSLAVPSSSSFSDSPSAPNPNSNSDSPPLAASVYLSSSSPSSYLPSSNQTSSHPTTTLTKPQSHSQDPSQTLTTHALFFLLALVAGAWVIQILLPSLLVVCKSIGGGKRRRRGWSLKGLVLWYSSSSGLGSEGGYGSGEKYGYPPHTPGCAPANVPRDVCEDEAEEEDGGGEADEDTEKRGEKREEQEQHYPKKMVRHPHRPPLPVHCKRNGRERKHGPRNVNLPPHVPAYYPSFMRALAVPMRMRFPDFIGGVFGSLFSRRSSSSAGQSSSSSSSSRRNSSSRTSSSSRRRTTNTAANANTYTLAQTLILTLYTLPLLYTTFAFGSNPLTDALRTGFVGLVQVPIAVGLAGRNGCGMVLSLVGGGGGKGGAGGPGGAWSYEKVNWLHRWVGRGVVVGVNLHCWHYFYSWTLSGTFMKNIVAPSNMWGMVGLVAVDAMFLFSLKSIRERMYGFFLATHVLGLLVLLPAIYMHKPALLTYVLVSSGLYVSDHLFRLLKTRVAHAYLTPLPGLDMTAIEIPKLNRGWRAGQHVRVCVVDPGVSSWWWGWGCGMEVHPLTIASVEGREEGMVLMCKRVGGWSGRVYDLARGACDRRNGTEGGGGGGGRKVRVIVEGPYGGLGNTNVASFSAAVYVCGGSGITFALAGITDLVDRDLRGESRVKHIQLVWVVPDPGCLEPLLPTLADLIHRSVYTPLRISVFYTRAPTGKQPAYFDAVDASPFAAPAQANGIHPTFTAPLALAPPLAQENSNDVTTTTTNPKQQQQHHHQRHPSHTLISPVSEDAQAFARAYQQRLDQQRNARPRPPPSQRPASPYESPRAAPAPPPPPPPSAYNPPRTKSKNGNGNGNANPGGPQRQDSNASARTLVDASASGPYPRKSSLKRTHTATSGTHPMLSSHPSGAHHRLPTNLTLAPGRPKLSPFLEQALDRALRLSHSDLKDLDDDGDDYSYDHDRERHGREGKLCGMVVAVCGPAGLAEEVAGAVAGLEWERTQRVGGVEIVEEVFGC